MENGPELTEEQVSIKPSKKPSRNLKGTLGRTIATALLVLGLPGCKFFEEVPPANYEFASLAAKIESLEGQRISTDGYLKLVELKRTSNPVPSIPIPGQPNFPLPGGEDDRYTSIYELSSSQKMTVPTITVKQTSTLRRSPASREVPLNVITDALNRATEGKKLKVDAIVASTKPEGQEAAKKEFYLDAFKIEASTPDATPISPQVPPQ